MKVKMGDMKYMYTNRKHNCKLFFTLIMKIIFTMHIKTHTDYASSITKSMQFMMTIKGHDLFVILSASWDDTVPCKL